ncbi:tRNA 2-thiouridine(34) synthase MnmA [Dokdonia sp. 4H-3-7-5]|jgi:tRNA-specific 2-thiouridylase|uniref:tRNA 2-thiouridine(34) synthase MnmA n=1 Tax=Dokdonia sp. (strain 4H-3-7-5) TaxID=983548 RepID=UPI00020A6D44|nr:tRNA 2-thiouridine(34) synthase MnmA [Dokdonia sp. 4H-3-7-5]AEE18016.1 tRNA (5-methylaminomethyl-2-thiouridylate)-methyltransferase [Dokdonia sp. 4H-3-7-5]
MKTVVVGLSGGVDSSVTAHLLKEQGYNVIGLFMKNWHDDSVTISDECPWLDDSNDAMLVAEKLGIPFQTVDLSEQYRERIVNYMFKEYEMGRTPNPDVLCNREIKFDVFMKIALSLGADYVATGHYCQKTSIEVDGKTMYQLKAGADDNKDQSYFLCQLSQEQLAKTLFPIGHLQKPKVREIALEQDLVTAGKKDSQGLCFIGKVRLPDFLQQQLKPKEGVIVEVMEDTIPEVAGGMEASNAFAKADLENLVKKPTYSVAEGKVVGKHQGAHYFTIGQRKGLAVGGTVEPLFVIDTDVDENVIYTGQGKNHRGLYRKGLFVKEEEIHWIREDLTLAVDETMEVEARIRYRQPLEKATLYRVEGGMYVIFDNPQTAIAEGQFVAWHHGEECLGSGVIS